MLENLSKEVIKLITESDLAANEDQEYKEL